MRIGIPDVQSEVQRSLGVLVLLACLATLIYSNTFSSPFHLDDAQNIVSNRQIQQWANLGDASGSRYVGFVSLAVTYHLGGLQVFGYHLGNLLIHILTGFLVYTVVSLLCRTPALRMGPALFSPRQAQGMALMTALLFVAHPIQTQAVTYIVQRFTSLAALFYLLAVVCYLRWRLATSETRARFVWYVGALGSTILAMKTKESSFTLPFALLLVEGSCFRPLTRTQWWPLIPFLLTLPIIPLSLPADLTGAGGLARETADISRLSYLFTQFRVIVTYLRLLLFPVHQNLDYDYPLYDSFLHPPVWGSFLVLLSLFVGAIYLLVFSPRYRLVGFGVAWFFLALSVESSIIPIRDVIFEHRLYLPSVGVLLASSAVVARRLPRLNRIAIIGVVSVIVVLAVATYRRNRVWADEITLWNHVVAASPQKARGHNGLGYTYLQQGRVDEAILEFLTAIRLKPDFPDAHGNLGNAYLRQGRLDEAVQEYLTVTDLKPALPEAHYNLGNAYAQQGRLEQAVQEYLTAVRLNPDLPEAHYGLGNSYVDQGRPDQAIPEYLTTLHLNPDYPEAHSNLGNIYLHQGRSGQAIQEYVTALRLSPTYPEAHNNLGYAYLQEGRLDEAIMELVTAVHLKPTLPEAHENLGDAYTRQGRGEEAIREYVTAIRLGANQPEVYYKLGTSYQLKGLRHEARKQFEIILQSHPDFVPAQQALKSLDVRS